MEEGVSLFGEYGASKIGNTKVVQIPVATWTPVVLTSLVRGRAARGSSFIIKAAGTVYIAQGNSNHSVNGSVVTLPAAPDLATDVEGPGYFELLAGVAWRVDVELPSENTLFFYATGLTIVRITELTITQFDQ
jgi:hypothetical protein